MWSGFVALVASLGSAALTGYIVFRLFRLQGRREDAAAHWQSRRQAYVRLLAATGTVVHTADTLHLIMATRSGWGEGVDVLLHVQRPLNAVDYHDLLRPDTTALYEAMAEVAAVGSLRAVTLGGTAVERCTEVMRAATERGGGRSALVARVLGEKWTVAQAEAWRAKTEALQVARADFASLAREELGVEIARPASSRDQELLPGKA